MLVKQGLWNLAVDQNRGGHGGYGRQLPTTFQNPKISILGILQIPNGPGSGNFWFAGGGGGGGSQSPYGDGGGNGGLGGGGQVSRWQSSHLLILWMQDQNNGGGGGGSG